LSRRDEREADWFASDLTGRPQAMASALVKLSRENLSNLHPHPLYAKFYYSHPPVVERIRKLSGQKTEDR
jgi:STE24 endopeptidase